MQIELRHRESLKPYEANSRTHSPEQVRQIAASMRAFGWTLPILADGDTIVAGHGRDMAAALIYSEGDFIRWPNGAGIPFGMVPVIPCDGWTPEQVRAYVIADNKLALNAGWDDETLRAELAALADLGFDLDLTGFSAGEIAALNGEEPLDLDEEEEGDREGTGQKFVAIDGEKVPVTDDEVDALLAAVRDYTSRNGMSFGFFSKLLNDAGANTALED